MQGIVQKIVADLEELNRRLDSHKLASEGELGKLGGEITFNATNGLFVTEQKVTQLTRGLEKQTKSATDNSGLPRDLMAGIEILGIT